MPHEANSTSRVRWSEKILACCPGPQALATNLLSRKKAHPCVQLRSGSAFHSNKEWRPSGYPGKEGASKQNPVGHWRSNRRGAPLVAVVLGLFVLGLVISTGRMRAERLSVARKVSPQTVLSESAHRLGIQESRGKPALRFELKQGLAESRAKLPADGIACDSCLNDDDDAELIFCRSNNGRRRPIDRGISRSFARAQGLQPTFFGARFLDPGKLVSLLAPGQEGSTDPPCLFVLQSSVLPTSCLPPNVPELDNVPQILESQSKLNMRFTEANQSPKTTDFGRLFGPERERRGARPRRALFKLLTQSQDGIP